MSRRAGRNGIAWENRFETPTIPRLLAGLLREPAAVVNHARKRLNEATRSTELLVWYGPPWRWTIAYQTPGSVHPWAFIIPRPAQPLLALPLDHDVVASLVRTGLSKLIRSGLTAAPRVGDTYWTEWDLTTKPQAEEILRLAMKRFEAGLATVA
jgi:hypothetical protein